MQDVLGKRNRLSKAISIKSGISFTTTKTYQRNRDRKILYKKQKRARSKKDS